MGINACSCKDTACEKKSEFMQTLHLIPDDDSPPQSKYSTVARSSELRQNSPQAQIISFNNFATHNKMRHSSGLSDAKFYPVNSKRIAKSSHSVNKNKPLFLSPDSDKSIDMYISQKVEFDPLAPEECSQDQNNKNFDETPNIDKKGIKESKLRKANFEKQTNLCRQNNEDLKISEKTENENSEIPEKNINYFSFSEQLTKSIFSFLKGKI